MKIRVAAREDLPRLMEMGFAMHQETEFRDLGFDFNKVTAFFINLIEREERILFVAVNESGPIGMLGGRISEQFFSHDLFARDEIFYVRPECRGSRAAKGLMDAWVDWIEGRDVKIIIMGTSSGMEHAERAGRFLRHYGFEQIGNLFRSIK